MILKMRPAEMKYLLPSPMLNINPGSTNNMDVIGLR
jgi:hypothetical protein